MPEIATGASMERDEDANDAMAYNGQHPMADCGIIAALVVALHMMDV